MIEIPRPQRTSPLVAGLERAQLESWLDFYRATLITKCAGLTFEQLTLRHVATSDLTLLGILRHMTRVEQYWFEMAFSGHVVIPYYASVDDPDADFHDLASASLDEVVANFQEVCQRSRELALGHNLRQMTAKPWREGHVNLRWIYIHMIEEYARHCGHADLLREMTDGEVDD
ncbi:MAG TPA: DinB family protein [Acidimicrobiales bacterium]|nr:DinB family protein [Acidimicrobiales bacterium]